MAHTIGKIALKVVRKRLLNSLFYVFHFDFGDNFYRHWFKEKVFAIKIIEENKRQLLQGVPAPNTLQ